MDNKKYKQLALIKLGEIRDKIILDYTRQGKRDYERLEHRRQLMFKAHKSNKWCKNFILYG